MTSAYEKSRKELLASLKELTCDVPHGRGVFKTEDIGYVVQLIRSYEWHSARAEEFAKEVVKFFNR